MPVRLALRQILAVGIVVLFAAPAAAQDQQVPPVQEETELTPEEKAERESRKACKVAICDAFYNRDPNGSDISCHVVKTWRKEHLQKIVSKAKVSWPWGRVQCVADIKLERDMLIKAMTEPKHEAVLQKHQVACKIAREEGDAELKFDFSPKVTFEGGKATKAVLNWGKIEAPTLVKGAMWTATATDNTFNVLDSMVVEDINDFISKKCMEVKDEWAK
ncbi:MAG TPA: hypothetical protein VF226_07775 [Hyphomicrobiaceae bacterium]|jgi:hypothetical protein